MFQSCWQCWQGYLDDRSTTWGELKKGTFDVIISGLVAWALIRGQSHIEVWWPLYAPKMGAEAALDGTMGLLAPFLLSSWVLLGWSDIPSLCFHQHDKLQRWCRWTLGKPARDCIHRPRQNSVKSWGTWSLPATFWFPSMKWEPVGRRGDLVSGRNDGLSLVQCASVPTLMGDAGSRPLGLLLGIFFSETGNPLIFFFVAFLILGQWRDGIGQGSDVEDLQESPIKVTCPLHDHFMKEEMVTSRY